MAWQPKDGCESLMRVEIDPRLTLIMALDNYGKIYYSLLQANANVAMM